MGTDSLLPLLDVRGTEAFRTQRVSWADFLTALQLNQPLLTIWFYRTANNTTDLRFQLNLNVSKLKGRSLLLDIVMDRRPGSYVNITTSASNCRL